MQSGRPDGDRRPRLFQPERAVSGPLQVLFAPAAGPQIGGGHLMRGLALAEALHARGAVCTFALPPWGERLLQRFAAAPPAVHPLARTGEPAAIAAAVEAVGPDVLVLDDYSLAAADLAALGRRGPLTLVIDDLADRTYACDLLVDPGYGREASDYALLVPVGCEVLAGPPYALLRAAFTRRDPLDLRPTAGPVRRAFVSFGLSDVEGIAARATAQLRACAPEVRLDVALAADAASLPRLQAMAAADPALMVHVDARDVATLMQAADVAVGAGGSATWERCALGLPTLAVVVADNQREMIARLAEAGVVLAVDMAAEDFGGGLRTAFSRLCAPTVREALRRASQALCDGRGAERVAQAMIRLAGR